MGKIIVRDVPRERDEAILDAIKAKRAGKSWTAVARQLGTASGSASYALCAVREADVTESGEPEGKVRGAYW